MEHNDQVQKGPLTGDSGELKKDSSEENNSATKPSEKKEEIVNGPTENTEISSEVEEKPVPVSPEVEKTPPEPDPPPQEEPLSKTEPASVEEPVSIPEPVDAAEAETPPEPEIVPQPEAKVEPEVAPEPEAKVEPEVAPEPEAKVEPEVAPEPEAKVEPEVAPEPEVAAEADTAVESGATQVSEAPPKPEAKAKAKAKEEPVVAVASEVSEETKVAEGSKASEKAEGGEAKKGKPTEIADFDYSTLTREDLVNRLEVLLENQDVHEIRSDVDHVKVNFYKKNKAEIELKRKKFIGEGGNIEDFQVMPDALEEKIKGLLKQYRDQKTEFNKSLDQQKKDNLQRKYEVIENIKELANRKESINRTFNDFRDLQREWRLIGLVPQQNLKDLWDTYNHHVEKFYDFIKINKELRDLDLKKNMELKMQLCERAEELLLESSVVNAFQSLQKYHDRWREIGPVPLEARTELWERFKDATTKINRKHQDYYEDLKKAQKKNLEQKFLLCEQAEDISNQVLETHKQWDEKSKELIEIQKVWKTIGFAPKKDNNKIYERFRKACDTFFNRKREFYTHSKELQMNNLQMKTDLCVQAESFKESTEWKKSTDDLINLQKKWKEIGPVPKKHSDAVWKRFRAACDHFFHKKSDYYKNIDKTYSQNLEAKKNLLKEIESLKLSDNVEDNFKFLNEFQRRWSEIGFVPFKEKEALQDQFRQAINKHFDNLDINDNRKNMLKFRNKLNNMSQKPKSDMKIGQERERYINRLQQLRNDIVLWENNIGFFAKSKNAESMINEVQSRIDNAKESIILLEQKIELIDSMD